MVETKTEVDNLIELVPKAPKTKLDPRALNAYRHGITGQVRFFASPEEEAAFQKHCDGYQADFSTSGVVEKDLCHRLADTAWRMNTAAAMEDAIRAEIIAHPVVRHCEHEQADVAFEYSRVWKDAGHQLNLLSIYQRRLQRNYDNIFDKLVEVQQMRRAAEKQKEHAEQQAAAEAAHLQAVADTKARMRKEWGLDKLKPAQPSKFDFSKTSAAVAALSPTPPRS